MVSTKKLISDVTDIATGIREMNRKSRRTLAQAADRMEEMQIALEDFIETVERVDPGVYRDCVDQAKNALSGGE